MAPVARISIPRLGLREVALDSGSGQALAFGPTFLPSAAAPGAPGTAVAAAHRDTHFRGLKDIRIDDLIIVEGIDGTSTTYRVDSLQVSRWDRFAVSTDRLAMVLRWSLAIPSERPATARCALSCKPRRKVRGQCGQRSAPRKLGWPNVAPLRQIPWVASAVNNPQPFDAPGRIELEGLNEAERRVLRMLAEGHTAKRASPARSILLQLQSTGAARGATQDRRGQQSRARAAAEGTGKSSRANRGRRDRPVGECSHSRMPNRGVLKRE